MGFNHSKFISPVQGIALENISSSYLHHTNNLAVAQPKVRSEFQIYVRISFLWISYTFYTVIFYTAQYLYGHFL
jgi:hypothetical protein